LEQVQIPAGVTQVYIMADKDVSQTGEKSANKLVQRMLEERKNITVKVCLPPIDIHPGEKSLVWLNFYTIKQLEAIKCVAKC
jgi:hypothetical protein